MQKKPSVLFITMGINEPASRYRVRQYIPLLKKEGFTIVNLPLILSKYNPNNYHVLKKWVILGFSVFLKFLSILLAPFFDIVFLQRTIYKGISPLPEKLLYKINKNIIFDFDDAIWEQYDKKNNPVDTVLSLSKKVVAGNAYLEEYARKFNKNTTIIPSPISTLLIKTKPKQRPDVVTIGWSGSRSNLPFIESLSPVFKQLHEKYGSKIEILIMSDTKPNNLGAPFTHIKWNPEVEYPAISQFDIGLMPLNDNKFTRGKCSFKILQYMAVGAPAIASPVGMNNEVIEDGKSGFLARSNNDFLEKISYLIDNPNERAKFGARGKELFQKKYTAKHNVEKLINVLIDMQN